MTRNRTITIVALVAALALSVSFVGAQAQTPYDVPPKITKKNKAKEKKRMIKVARVTCGTGTCNLTAASARVKASGNRFKGKFTAGSRAALPAGQTKTIKVKVSKAADSALEDANKGKVRCSITVTSTTGLSASSSGKTKVKT